MTNTRKNKGLSARLKNLRISPRKLKLIADLIRGKDVQTALNSLRFNPKKMSVEITKLVESAVNNASQIPGINVDNLYVKTILVDKAVTLKRFTARARGSGSRILKRTSHITLELDQKI